MWSAKKLDFGSYLTSLGFCIDLAVSTKLVSVIKKQKPQQRTKLIPGAEEYSDWCEKFSRELQQQNWSYGRKNQQTQRQMV